MTDYQVKTYSVEETKQLAEKLANLLNPGDVITLEGDLGAGKTTFTKGLANGIGVKRNVNSPTYTIIKEYQGRVPFYHMDVYRLEDTEEDIGFDEYFDGNGITVVEWAHFIEAYLPAERLNIVIASIDGNTRLVEFFPIGSRFERVAADLIG